MVNQLPLDTFTLRSLEEEAEMDQFTYDDSYEWDLGPSGVAGESQSNGLIQCTARALATESPRSVVLATEEEGEDEEDEISRMLWVTRAGPRCLECGIGSFADDEAWQDHLQFSSRHRKNCRRQMQKWKHEEAQKATADRLRQAAQQESAAENERDAEQEPEPPEELLLILLNCFIQMAV